jgi:hypothetical protein
MKYYLSFYIPFLPPLPLPPLPLPLPLPHYRLYQMG